MNNAALVPDNVPANRIVDFDVYAPTGIEHGYHAAWKRLQEPGVADLVWTPHNGGHWIAARGAMIEEFLGDPDNFSARLMMVPKAAGMEHKLVPMNMDPPEHGPYRQVINQGLRIREVRGIEALIRNVAVELIDGFAADGRVDFCAAYAQIFPIKVFLAFSNLPISDASLLTGFAAGMTRPEGSTPEAKATSLAAANAGFFDYITPTVAARKAAPGDDWISKIIHSEVGGAPVTDYEISAMITLVMLAGLDTVINFLPFCMEYLARHPDQVAQLAANPRLVPRHAEELFRRFPVVAQARLVTHNIVRDGVTLRAGDMVLVPSTLHGIDERQHTDPMTLDFTRRSMAHATFGSGAHICAGLHLARMEVAVTLQEWLARIPAFRLAPGFAMVAHSGVVATVEALELEWDA